MAEKWVKAYGDTLDDGRVQMSFTLPVSLDDVSKEAAKRMALLMGLDNAAVVHAEDMGFGFSFYVVYGQCRHQVDLNSIQVVKPEFEALEKDEILRIIEEDIKRDVVMVGACIETDAHTVGIDAIMNMKGFNGRKGLESYRGVKAINMGAQVDSETLVAKAIETNADAILVSQVVTQKDVHLDNLTRLADILEAEGLRDKIILAVGGPRISHELAKELGYDVGFGPETYADDVASFVVQEIGKRK